MDIGWFLLFSKDWASAKLAQVFTYWDPSSRRDSTHSFRRKTLCWIALYILVLIYLLHIDSLLYSIVMCLMPIIRSQKVLSCLWFALLHGSLSFSENRTEFPEALSLMTNQGSSAWIVMSLDLFEDIERLWGVFPDRSNERGFAFQTTHDLKQSFGWSFFTPELGSVSLRSSSSKPRRSKLPWI